MKNTAKVILLILCLSLSIVLLTACGGTEGEQETTVDTTLDTSVGTEAVTEDVTTADTAAEGSADTAADTVAETETEADTAANTLDEATLKDALVKAFNAIGKQSVYSAVRNDQMTVNGEVVEHFTDIKTDGANYFVNVEMDGEQFTGYAVLADKVYINIMGTKEYFSVTPEQRAELLVELGLAEDENTEVIEYVYSADDFTGVSGVSNPDGSLTVTVTGLKADLMLSLARVDAEAMNLVNTLTAFTAVIDAEGRMVSMNYEIVSTYDTEVDGEIVVTETVMQTQNTYAYADIVISEPEDKGEYMLTTFAVYMGYQPDSNIAAANGMPVDADSYTLDASNTDYDVETQYGFLTSYPLCYKDKTFTLVGTVHADDGSFTLQLLSDGMDTILPLSFPEGAPLPKDGDKVTVTATFTQIDDTCEGANFLCFAMQVTAMTTAPGSSADDDTAQGTFMYVNVNTNLNVRSGPGTSNEVIGSFPRGARVDVLEISDGWAKIVFAEGAEGVGYVSAAYLSETQPV